MRLILTWLAIANLRWTAAETERGIWHDAESSAAFARAQARMAIAHRLMDRAGVPRRLA